jgi:hypothetical protein
MLTVITFSGWSQPAQQPAQPPIVVRVAEMPPTPHRDWIDKLEAFGPLTAAGVALIVGITQLFLQWQQVRQGLFEERYRVYRATHDFAAEVSKYGSRTDAETDKSFANDTAHAEFLFGPDVLEFIEFIRSIAKKFVILDGEMRNPSITQEDLAIKSGLRDQLMSQMDQTLARTNEVFRRYFSDRRPWYARLKVYRKRLMDGSEQRLNSRY